MGGVMNNGHVCPITIRDDMGDHWLCDTPHGDALLYPSMANDYPDTTEFMASMVPHRDTHGPKWFINGLASRYIEERDLTGVYDGWDAYYDLMAKARLAKKVIVLGDRSRVWYVNMETDFYLDTYDEVTE